MLLRGAMAVAAGRVAVGLTALAWPAGPARVWAGAAGNDLATRVFGRATGARDLALGLGALAALRRQESDTGSASRWVAARVLSDALDVAVTLRSWHELPVRGRGLGAASSGGAALVGVAAAAAARPAPGDAQSRR